MSLRIVGFAGSLSRPSKTRALVDLITTRAAATLGATAATDDLTDLQPAFGASTTLDDLDGLPRAIVASILSADALVVGSPVYKGSYTGLFKHRRVQCPAPGPSASGRAGSAAPGRGRPTCSVG